MTSTRSIRNLQREKNEEKTLPASVLGQRKQLIEEPQVTAPSTVPQISPYIYSPYSDQGVVDMKFDYDDVLSLPAKQSSIDSRYREVNPYIKNSLPLFTAPMDTVINRDCLQDFTNNKISIVLPRTDKNKRFAFGFNSFSLDEFEQE